MTADTLDADAAREVLYAVMNRELSFEEKAERALDVGERYLDVDNGHVTRVDQRTDYWRRSRASSVTTSGIRSTSLRGTSPRSVRDATANHLEEAATSLDRMSDLISDVLSMARQGREVEDDGAGIDPERREGVFDTGYSTGSGGIGLGLSIVQSVVTAHDWSISVVESRSGGARFEIADVLVATAD